MLPVACLPVCGILMGIGYILAPAAMAGEVAGFTAGGFAYTLGLFMIKAGGALIDNMAWLFAIGVAIGMSDDNDGTAALAGLVAMLLFQNLLSSGVVSALTGKSCCCVRQINTSLSVSWPVSLVRFATIIQNTKLPMRCHSSAANVPLLL